MKRLELIDGCLHVYEGDRLIMKTRGNPSKANQLFNSLEEAETWLATVTPSEPEILEEEATDETNI